jgi:NTP pyrophosphatase (non-canonical NTP hydrolase)
MKSVDMMPAVARPEDPIWTTTIMTYELGSLIRSLVKARLKGKKGDECGRKAYLAEAKIELADLLTQSHFLAEQMGWKVFELEKDGYQRFCERMKEMSNEDSMC